MALLSPSAPVFSSNSSLELAAAVATEAVVAAERVADFLTAVGIVGSPENPVRLDADFLLELAAAMQLLAWENGGLTLHREAGLPSARELIVSVFKNLAAHKCIPEELQVRTRVLGLFAERFAWHARSDWNASVALDLLDENAALDALADFLWAHRDTQRTVDSESH